MVRILESVRRRVLAENIVSPLLKDVLMLDELLQKNQTAPIRLRIRRIRRDREKVVSIIPQVLNDDQAIVFVRSGER